jgi:hypothetical protein
MGWGATGGEGERGKGGGVGWRGGDGGRGRERRGRERRDREREERRAGVREQENLTILSLTPSPPPCASPPHPVPFSSLIFLLCCNRQQETKLRTPFLLST